jgi:putative restriction endonuclease
LRRELATELLYRHFPETIHQDVLDAIGLTISDGQETATTRRRRDPKFRMRVLRAYERKCSVCGYGLWLDDRPVGLEAAHIKWHQAGGPDKEPNGLAMCSMHHKLFDRGVFSLGPDRAVLVSELAHGNDALGPTLLRYHGALLRPPVRSEFAPAQEFIAWHREEVFRGPAREIT